MYFLADTHHAAACSRAAVSVGGMAWPRNQKIPARVGVPAGRCGAKEGKGKGMARRSAATAREFLARRRNKSRFPPTALGSNERYGQRVLCSQCPASELATRGQQHRTV